MNIIIKFYYYCFYRLTNAYKVLDEKDPEIFASGLLSLCISFNILSLFSIPLILCEIQYSLYIVAIVVVLFILLGFLFVFTKKRYLLLIELWKNESPKYKKIRLYLIWIYVIISLIIYFIMVGIMY